MLIAFSLMKLNSDPVSSNALNKNEPPSLLYSKTFAVELFWANEFHIQRYSERTSYSKSLLPYRKRIGAFYVPVTKSCLSQQHIYTLKVRA
ncbi:hypothetical protein TNIN_490321 [Trichonephila inaurata madagascariensis]|uniref:Uncharacterized protein n=1 Tax=Trichonephila inaurata madagascariensis TaxID=2747483 RepID=A0A8X6MDQ6_9ARAC|nr:hypothetical protein TNIN_490321 [Trichonephila inaurata madagascariensis]